eukprot:TRINITY_DN1620_c0_g1_i5.p1 TRINITY_DN1620_c0_g1~~TRINITY_DN1620_c0_g1_i5.p1  ORF type:complete len:1023 (+),score=138.19 TRINITY_DN1620_c0_g1_i5:371-3439(+)
MKELLLVGLVVWVACSLRKIAAQSEEVCQNADLFPALYQDQTFIGCIDFGDVTWCQLQDGEYTPCPPDFLTQLIQQQSAPEEPYLAPTIEITQVIPSGSAIDQYGTNYEVDGGVQEPAVVDPQDPAPLTGAEDEEAAAIEQLQQVVDGRVVTGQPVVDVFDNCGEGLGQCVIINEVMSSNGNTLFDSDSDNSDWIEFVNMEDEDVYLRGWFVSDNSNKPTKWMFPDVRVGAKGMIVIFASGKDRRVPGFELHTNFRLNSRGEYLALYRPDGTVSSAILPRMPPQYEDITYGRPNLETVGPSLSALVGDSNKMSYLEKPTPGLPNEGPLLNGPIIISITEAVQPQPTAEDDIIVSAQLMPNFYEVVGVKLTVSVNFDTTFELEMTLGENSVYTAIIPSDNFNEGDMVRWYAEASDVGGKTSRSPPFTTPDYPEYYGTVVYSPEIRSVIPYFQWFVQDPMGAISVEGSRSSLFYNGYLYDNVFTRRRGMTTLTWPKPKIKFDFKGSIFEYNPDRARVEEFNLQSFWMETGEDSYMREVVGLKVLQEAGIAASDSFYLTLFMNNQFFGLFAFIEQVDDNFLERWGLSTSGFLYKSSHVEFTNLRWDQKLSEYEFIWRLGNHKNQQNYVHIYNFTQGLAGGGPGTRSQYVIDHVNLPQIVNEMAIQTMLLNMDRCTKNFYVYFDVINQEWYRIPWDMERAFGISSGYGGIPAPDYCILVGEQWNSPLYCNNEHPQDMVCYDPFTGSLVDPHPLKGCANQQCGEEHIPTLVNGELPAGYGIPENYDDDFTQTSIKSGASQTYNHLTDAILDIPETRQMYLRRLRSVMDQFIISGRLIQIINETYSMIKDYADLDNQYWSTLALQLEPTWKGNVVNNVHNGYKQLVEEQIPRRSQQLYITYGPGGRLPLIPDQQPDNTALQILTVDAEESDSDKHYIQVYNPNTYAADISDWEITGSVEFSFAPGTVVPAESSVYVTASLRGFRTRETSPTGYERNFAVGPWVGNLPLEGYVLTLFNQDGVRIDQKLA